MFQMPEAGYVFTYQRINPEEKNNYFVDIYKFVLEFDEKDVKVQDEEVAGFEIATVEQIKAYAKQGISCIMTASDRCLKTRGGRKMASTS